LWFLWHDTCVGCPLPKTIAGGGDGASMRFNDGLGDSEAKPCAAQPATAGLVGAVETVENSGEMFGRNAIPIIGYLNTGCLPILPKPQVNTTVGMAQSVRLLRQKLRTSFAISPPLVNQYSVSSIQSGFV